MKVVSVIVPLYNKAKYIRKTLTSVVKQTHPEWEIIVVDDGSTDNSLKVVLDYKNSLPRDQAVRIKVLHQNNLGQWHARYKGLSSAKGEFVAMLDADDLWSPKKLEFQLEYLDKFPDIDLVLTNYCIYSEGGKRPKAVSFTPVEKRILGWANTEYYGGLVESTGLFRRKFLENHMEASFPGMSGGLQLCIKALQLKRIGCTEKYLSAYIENLEGWHFRKDDLVKSIEVISRNEDINEYIRSKMKIGLERHLFFWYFRQGSIIKRLQLISDLVTRTRIGHVIYAFKSISRSLVAQIRFLRIKGDISELEAIVGSWNFSDN